MSKASFKAPANLSPAGKRVFSVSFRRCVSAAASSNGVSMRNCSQAPVGGKGLPEGLYGGTLLP